MADKKYPVLCFIYRSKNNGESKATIHISTKRIMNLTTDSPTEPKIAIDLNNRNLRSLIDHIRWGKDSNMTSPAWHLMTKNKPGWNAFLMGGIPENSCSNIIPISAVSCLNKNIILYGEISDGR